VRTNRVSQRVLEKVGMRRIDENSGLLLCETHAVTSRGIVQHAFVASVADHGILAIIDSLRG